MSGLAPGLNFDAGCPVCEAAETRSTGMVRLKSGEVAEGRECRRCGARWAVDDDGREVATVEGGGL
jgi:hypothetical protein